MKKKVISAGMGLAGIVAAALLMLSQPEVKPEMEPVAPALSSFRATSGGGKLVYYRIGRTGNVTVEEITTAEPIKLERGKAGKLKLAKGIEVVKAEVKRYKRSPMHKLRERRLK